MKIYLASPFFNAEQLERVKYIEDMCSQLKNKVFSPRLDTLVTPNSDAKEKQHAFDANLEGILDCDYMLAVTDGKDVGTMFEVGYAYANNIPILFFAETLGDRPFNLMLAQSARLGICKSKIELMRAVVQIEYATVEGYAKELGEKSKYDGNIE